ncbi:hypothetical protein C8J56DRAFT_884340 [Mycena floridula]|nr:hypothetical protein C8J56DRAFT_884340 [Mycena floridula]
MCLLSDGNKHNGPFFKHGKVKNVTQADFFCTACIEHHQHWDLNAPVDIDARDTEEFTAHEKSYKDACKATGLTQGENFTMAAHILGNWTRLVPKRSQKDSSPGPAASEQHESKQPQLTMYTALHMPFGKEETKAFQDQALHAVISVNLPFSVFENLEVKVLFGMARTTVLVKLPSGKVIAGRLLMKVANLVQAKLEKVLKGQEIGLNTDGWKSHTKASVNGICANYNYKSYTLDLVEVTAQKKDGLAQYEQFAKMIDDTEEKYDCIWKQQRSEIVAEESQLILGNYFKVNTLAAQIAEDATALLGWLNNHGQVHKIFDKSQAAISSDQLKHIIIFSYLVANLTHWTTHYVTFMNLLHLKDALQLAVITHHHGIIEAQVGAAKARGKDHLEEEANMSCNRIMNGMFWNGLKNLCGDIEPVCYATNIWDVLHFAAHPEPEVARDMCKRLEKRWADCDQLLFSLCLVLNPFESLSCFGTEANFSNYKLQSMIVEATSMTSPSTSERNLGISQPLASLVVQGNGEQEQKKKKFKI